MNQHCGKHDKIYDPDMDQSCPGCVSDEALKMLSESEDNEEVEEKPKRGKK
jgi:hypothetical protein